MATFISTSPYSQTPNPDSLWPALAALEERHILYNGPSTSLLERQRTEYLSWLSFVEIKRGSTAAQISRGGYAQLK